MHRIDTSTANPDAHGVGKAGFRSGSSPGTASTRLNPDWFNSVQEELCNLIEGFGITLSKPSKVQLLAAINKIATLTASRLISAFGWDITATTGIGVNAQGAGSSRGGNFQGGASGGTGVKGTGGGSTGIGVEGAGAGSGAGASLAGGTTGHGVTAQGGAGSAVAGGTFTGGSSDGKGVIAQGGSGGGGHGVVTTGGSGAHGIVAAGGTGNARGGSFTGSGTDAGVTAVGGASSGGGGVFTGGAPNGNALQATGVGNGAALVAAASGTAPVGTFTSTFARCLVLDGSTTNLPALRLMPQSSVSSAQVGDIWYDSVAGEFRCQTAAGTRTFTVT